MNELSHILLIGPGIADQFSNLSDALPKSYHQMADWIKGTPAGAKALAPAMDVPGVGRMAMLADPTAREHMAPAAALATSFDPHLYTVESVHGR